MCTGTSPLETGTSTMYIAGGWLNETDLPGVLNYVQETSLWTHTGVKAETEFYMPIT